MEIPPTVKIKAAALVMKGKKLEAIQYLQQHLSISLQDASTLTDHLENELSFFKNGIPSRNRSAHAGGPVLKLFGVIFLLGGLIGCGVIGKYVWDDDQFIKSAVLTKGTVIDIEASESVDDEGHTSIGYFPVFEYSYRGAIGKYRSNINFGSDNYTIGEIVDVYIDPSQPQRVVIDTFTERWGYYLLFGAFALMFTVMGMVMIRI